MALGHTLYPVPLCPPVGGAARRAAMDGHVKAPMAMAVHRAPLPTHHSDCSIIRWYNSLRPIATRLVLATDSVATANCRTMRPRHTTRTQSRERHHSRARVHAQPRHMKGTPWVTSHPLHARSGAQADNPPVQSPPAGGVQRPQP